MNMRHFSHKIFSCSSSQIGRDSASVLDHLGVAVSYTLKTDTYGELDMCGEMPGAFKKQAELLTDMNMDMESDLVEEVLQTLEEVCVILEGIRKSLDKDVKRSMHVPISDQEQRQPQRLLEDDTKSARMTLSRNRDSVTKVAPPENFSDILDDSEATHTFQLIYQDLKSWIERHFTRFIYSRDAGDTQSSDDRANSLPDTYRYRPDTTLHIIHGEVFERLFTSILAPFIVGTGNVALDHHLQLIDKEIWQHWRSILSNAISSHEKEGLEKTCDEIMQRTESKLGHVSTTDSKERRKELRQIVRNCLDFKKRLECQGNLFYFWWSLPGAALCEERMVSVTGQYAANKTVRRTLWPMFYRELPDEWVILAKEIVLASQGSSKGIESPKPFQSKKPATS
ncbi:hypothetical protein N7481_001255 [Penicillium waksmanii]|uniref:uncharacterized protein n=1 Tax=Penicillium waksmanii TaxID=69791 RepID=UPI0025487C05|nr:uncharacterized protein N7481_001255 [Penicillium waksmanii]KAJ6000846.1 hypothetical protein N7481_001255 [Penicillium waksmanii]